MSDDPENTLPFELDPQDDESDLATLPLETTRLEVDDDDDELTTELGAEGDAEDDAGGDAEDGAEAKAPAIDSDGPTQPPPEVLPEPPEEEKPGLDVRATADRCPYCLTFIGLSAARARGVRFCPLCGADWQTIGRTIEAPTGAVIPLDSDVPPPDDEDDLEDAPTSQFTRVGPTRRLPASYSAPVEPEPEPPEQADGSGPWLTLLVGLSLGLAGTMTVASLYERGETDNKPLITAPAPIPEEPPTVIKIGDAPTEAPAVPRAVAAGMHKGPTDSTANPGAATVAEPAQPAVQPGGSDDPPEAAPTPKPPPRPSIEPSAVQAALLDAQSLLPPAALVEITPRIDGDIIFLEGLVDSTDTLGAVVQAVAAVEHVRAVDSRGVRSAYRRYQVVSGDSLSKIAAKFYRNPDAWRTIWNANRDVVAQPELLKPGMMLKIPDQRGR